MAASQVKDVGHLTLLFVGSAMSLSFSNMLRRRIAGLPFVYRSSQIYHAQLQKERKQCIHLVNEETC